MAWLFGLAALMLLDSGTVLDAVNGAAGVFVRSVMPALFPMMVLNGLSGHLGGQEKRWMTDSTSRRLPAISSSRADLSPCRTRSSSRRVVALSSTASFEVLTPQISTFPCIYSKTSSGKR